MVVKDAEIDPVHVWLVLGKAFNAMIKFVMVGIQNGGLGESDFRVMEALLHKGPLPVNVIGQKVFLTPGAISTAVDRLVARGLVTRAESPEDRRIRVVALTQSGRALMRPIDRKQFEDIRQVLADFSPSELRHLERLMKKAGRRAEALQLSAASRVSKSKTGPTART